MTKQSMKRIVGTTFGIYFLLFFKRYFSNDVFDMTAILLYVLSTFIDFEETKLFSLRRGVLDTTLCDKVCQ
jgi:hypothetical protein